jgi:hypothetical protein
MKSKETKKIHAPWWLHVCGIVGYSLIIGLISILGIHISLGAIPWLVYMILMIFIGDLIYSTGRKNKKYNPYLGYFIVVAGTLIYSVIVTLAMSLNF